MLVTLLGIVMLVRLVLVENALAPMLVTVPETPAIVVGMIPVPPDPVYPVIVITTPVAE